MQEGMLCERFFFPPGCIKPCHGGQDIIISDQTRRDQKREIPRAERRQKGTRLEQTKGRAALHPRVIGYCDLATIMKANLTPPLSWAFIPFIDNG